MSNPMLFRYDDKEEEYRALRHKWAGYREFTPNEDAVPRHNKLRNGSIREQLKKYERVMICLDGKIDNQEARLYLDIRRHNLRDKILIPMEHWTLYDLKRAIKSLTTEDIVKMYHADMAHELVLIF